MTKENKKLLVEMVLKDLKEKYPSMPEYGIPIPKYTDSNANGLTKCIIDFLNHSGHQAERISSMGRIIDNSKVVEDVLGRKRTIGSKKYIKGTSTNGTADISSIILGKSVKIEVKIGKDRQSADQKKYEQATIKAGGLYWIVKDFDMFIDYYNALLNNTLVTILATHKIKGNTITKAMKYSEWLYLEKNNNFDYKII